MNKLLNVNEKVLAFNAVLNKPGHNSVAAVAFGVDTTVDRMCNHFIKHPYREGTLHISSCNDSIQLNFDFSTKEDLENSLHKIHVLKEAINTAHIFITRALALEESYKQAAEEYRNNAEKILEEDLPENIQLRLDMEKEIIEKYNLEIDE